MYKIVFKNLEKSVLAKEIVEERLTPILGKFPMVEPKHVRVTLTMDNSPTQPGPDLFWVKLHFRSGAMRGLVLEKSASNLYSALAMTVESLQARLGKETEKNRKILRQRSRRHKQQSVDAEAYTVKNTG